MLTTLATAEELALLKGALEALDAASFRALFDPSAPRERIPLPPPAIARPLRAFGLVDADRAGLVGRHRIRRIGGRFYVMELGVGELEYLQDVWPETDALLAELDAAPPGRLLDLGTGSGVVAVEAAARGHRVIATDLYETAIVLARFNARLNRLDGAIELREGHLFEPVAGERFDRVLANPHYGRADDQLRLEVLRAAPAHLRPDGELVLATALEWVAGGERTAPLAPLAVEHVLAQLAGDGLAIAVEPLDAHYKRDWFAAARSDEPIAGLTSRHRFVVRVTRPAVPRAGILHVRRPEEAALNVRDFVPLARVVRGGAHAVVTSAA
ncbi:MAG TPA: methyltransferase, partial [Polyangia bacterium]|nr:methyltransferase [Polyangia bacterium]